tara:strand:- start:8 stop:358 length:351 start_codon:yes stop_codon:yes gene_type:complete
MSCSSKYEKLVEYIKTQHEVYGNIMGFVDNLESEEIVSNFTMPDIKIDIPDSVVNFSMPTPYDDTLNINVTGADLFASMDGVDIAGISTANEEIFTVPSPIDDLTGLNITTDKDDK